MANTWYLTPSGAGAANGTSWANALPFTGGKFTNLFTAASNGDTLVIEGGKTYAITGPTVWAKSVTMEFRKQDGTFCVPSIQSNRTFPWPANGMWTGPTGFEYTAAVEGQNVFTFNLGGDGSVIRYPGVFNVQALVDVSLGAATARASLRVENFKGFNYTGMVRTSGTGNGQVDLVANDNRGIGYTKDGIARLFGNYTGLRNQGNSQNQFGNVTGGTSSLAHIQDVDPANAGTRYTYNGLMEVALNHNSFITGMAGYGQGDGIVMEESVDPGKVQGLYARGNYDRGFDSKAAGHISHLYCLENGYDVAMHVDSGDYLYVRDSYLGPTLRAIAGDPNKSANLQASGKLKIIGGLITQGSKQGSIYYTAVMTNKTSADTGVWQNGEIIVQGAVIKRLAGAGQILDTANHAHGTPTYTETNTTTNIIPATTVLFGCSAGASTPASITLLTPKILRSYTAFQMSGATTGMPVHHGMKPNLANVAARVKSELDSIRSYFAGVPDVPNCRVTIGSERDNDNPSGDDSLAAEYRNAWKVFVEVITQMNQTRANPLITVAICAGNVWSRAGGMDPWYVPWADELGWDVYDPTTFDNCAAYALAKWRPWSIPETGYTAQATSSATDAQQLARMQSDHTTYMAYANRPNVVMQFNNNGSDLTSRPNSAAQWRAYSA